MIPAASGNYEPGEPRMKLVRLMTTRWVLCLLLVSSAAAGAQTQYVSDQLEITLRSGPGNQYRILRMLESGTAVQVIERDDQGWSRIRTAGTEGWVLSRYLMNRPAARDQLASANTQVERLREETQKLRAELEATKAQLKDAQATVAELRRDNQALEQKVERAGRGLQLADTNQTLREQVATQQQQVQALEEQASELADRSRQDWFVVGAGVLIAGIIIGLIIPRIRWRRRERWDSW